MARPGDGQQRQQGQQQTIKINTGAQSGLLSPEAQASFGQSFGAVGQVVGGIQSFQRARELRNAGSREAQSIVEAALEDNRRRNIELARIQGAQRAQYSAAGVELTGTPQAVTDFTTSEAIRERELVLAGALQTAERVKRDARKRARSGSITGLVDTIVGSLRFGMTLQDESERVLSAGRNQVDSSPAGSSI